MQFTDFATALQQHAAKVFTDTTHLYTVDLNKDALWELYLDSFPAGTNEVFRERREYDCSACRHFVKSFGNVVAIKDGKVVTMWDFTTGDKTFAPVVKALAKFVKAHKVTDVFVSKERSFGTKENHELIDGESRTWHHLFVEMPAHLVYRGSDTEDTEKAKLRDLRNLFKRALEELTNDSTASVLELIDQGSLYKGDEWKTNLLKFRVQQTAFAATTMDKDLWCWAEAMKVSPSVARIRNSAVGTLLIDISEGTDLDTAVRKYEAVVAPANYKRPKAIFTKKMLEDAEKTIGELGLMDSLRRRHAVLDDLTINNVLFANHSAKGKLELSVFDDMKKSVEVSNPKAFDKLEEIGIDKFLKDVLPKATKLEALFEVGHTGNLVSLIAPQVGGSPSLFKWGNGFSWTYSGNIADSMKQRVKAAGGKVDGELRFSIQWNEDGKSIVDLDAHAVCPNGAHIEFSDKHPRNANGGFLDVDMISPRGIGVENITWPTGTRMEPGRYVFSVHNFSGHLNHQGFDAEIEFDGEIHSFNYRQAFRGTIDVAKVTVAKDGSYSIESLLDGRRSSAPGREVWGLTTGQFYPVTVCSFSPNFWAGEPGIGNKHTFFMLEGCTNDERPNGFFNEFLRDDLTAQKRVFEALGSRMAVEPLEGQLSGLGFSSTKRAKLVVRVTGKTTRVLKINF